MSNVTPLRSQETVVGGLKNALWIAELGRDGEFGSLPRYDEAMGAFGDIARLLRHAIEGLSEPNLAAVQAAEILVREYHGSLDDQRNARDVAAGILKAAVTGLVPGTWSGAVG